MPSLGVYQFIHNALEYDYPVIESLTSILPIAEQVVICECESTDNTLNVLKQFQEEHKDKVKIVHQPWVNHYSELSQLGNYASLFLDTDWKWQIQADEVIHENQYLSIKTWLNMIEKHHMKVSALTTQYTHFISTYNHTFPFCYQEIVRIHKRGSDWRLVGDACQLDGGNRKEVLNTDINVFHYGKVHSGKAGFKKEIDFQNLFTDLGFPDPKMKIMQETLGEDFCDYLYLFEDSIKKGEVKEFKGTHPSVMQGRIKEFKEKGYEQFYSKVKEDLHL